MCRSKVWQFVPALEQLRVRAEELFWSYSGFSDRNPPSSYQREDILEVHEKLLPKLKIQGLLRQVNEYAFADRYMEAEGRRIACMLPLQEYREQITGIYVFLVSEETVALDAQSTMEQLYTDIWQNAYLDAAREQAKELLAEQTGAFVSPCIAPGFYGMKLKDMAVLHELIDGCQIGVTVREDGMLTPEKSVLGFYLTLSHDLNILGKRCADCPARGKNCEFCMDKL